jgi:hypothetical protein
VKGASKHWQLIVLAVMMAIIAVPFAFSSRDHPAYSGDTTHHIEAVSSGVWGYPLEKLSIIPTKLGENNPARAFQWFDIAVVLATMTVLYFIFASLVSKWAGLVAVAMAVFCSAGIATLFFAGTIFSIINVCIILPLGLYFLIKWLIQGKWYQGALMLVAFWLFVVSHPTAVYLPFILLIFLGSLLLFKHYRNWKVYSMLGLVVLGGILSFFYTNYWHRNLTQAVLVPLSEVVFRYIGAGTLIILVFSVFYIKRNKIAMKEETKLLALALLSMIAVLIPLAFTGVTLGRAVLDLATVVALFTSCLLGAIAAKNKMLAYALPLVIVLSAIPLLKTWLFGAGI